MTDYRINVKGVITAQNLKDDNEERMNEIEGNITSLNNGKANVSHTHVLSDIMDYTPPTYSITPAASPPSTISFTETSTLGMTSRTWWAICYGNDRFVAVASGSNIAAYSYDGITWTEKMIGNTNRSWWSLCYGNGKFVSMACSTNIAAYSYDGETWYETSSVGSSAEPWRSVCYGNGKFVAIGGDSTAEQAHIAYSYDCVTWYMISITARSWWNVCYGNGKFVAIVRGPSIAAYSYDGITWTEVTISETSRLYHCICYGKDKFVALVSDSNIAAWSYDAITWYEVTIGETNQWWCSVCYGNGKYVAIANASNKYAYSNDGVTWHVSTISETNREWWSLCYGGGKFVAVIRGSTITAHSNDINIPQPTYSNDLSILTSMVGQMLYPVGSIYTSMNDVNPSQLFGFGTWERIRNRFLYCTDENVSGNVGGNVIHTHKYGIRYAGWYCNMKGLDKGDSIDIYDNGIWRRSTTEATVTATPVGWSSDHGDENTTGNAYRQDAFADTGSTSTLPPYLTVYAWQRTT